MVFDSPVLSQDSGQLLVGLLGKVPNGPAGSPRGTLRRTYGLIHPMGQQKNGKNRKVRWPRVRPRDPLLSMVDNSGRHYVN
jgi:hypothetical protein